MTAAARRPLLLLGGATLGVLVVRVGLGLLRTGPVLLADEAGYLGNARVLGDGMPFVMGSSPFYRSGYSLVLVPLLRLDLDPQLTYRLVLVVNAALAASVVPLLYVLARRALAAPPGPAVAAAFAGALYPAVTSMTQVALAENLLFPLTVTWLLLVESAFRERRSASRFAVCAAVGASAGLLWMTHGRMVVALPITAVVLVGVAVSGRGRRWASAVGLAAMATSIVVARAIDAIVVDRNYDGRRTDQVASALAPLDDLGGILASARNLVGQSWYLVVATFGLTALVVAREAPDCLRRLRHRRAGGGDVVLVALLAATLGLLALSALWLDAATRPDQLVYGRYVEPVVPALVTFGILALGRRPPRARFVAVAIGGTVLLTVAVAALRAGIDVEEGANRWNVSALPFVTGGLDPAIVLGAGCVAAGGMALVAGTARRRSSWLPLAVVALFAPTIAFTEATLVRRSENDGYGAGWTSPQATVEALGDAVAYDTAHFHNVAVKVYQWHLPHTRFELFSSDEESPPATLFFSAPTWADEHGDATATVVWEDRARGQVLWHTVRR